MIYVRSVVCAILVASCGCLDDAAVEEPPGGALRKIGAEYLRRVIDRLQSERFEGHPIELSEMEEPGDEEGPSEPQREHLNYVTVPPENSYPTASPAFHAEVLPSPAVSVPNIPPGLTAEELAAIYNAAVTQVANMPDIHSQAISDFHHPPPPLPHPPSTSSSSSSSSPSSLKSTVIPPAAQGPVGSLLPGYYYYYYPIKSFYKTQTEVPPRTAMAMAAAAATTTTTTPKPVVMHATVHMSEPSNKSVEPLFMAISGFIGMALMFAFSVLFVPKFGKLRSGEMNSSRRDLIALGRIVFDSLEGKDCAERLACELGRVLKNVKMDNKPLRVLEIVLPPNLGKQVSMIRKAAARNKKCETIACRLKKPPPPPPGTAGKKPWRKSQTPHDLWMKHFEKKTKFKQPQNIWVRNHPPQKKS